MASYKLIEPSIDKLRELACITWNLRYYEERFRRYKDPEDEKSAAEYRLHLDNWHTDWLKRND